MEAVRQRAPLFYQFGAFFLDPAKCVLLRGEEIVPISLKAFEMLLLLVQHRGEVLEKDDLLKHLWPDTVVEENNLARNISALRKALDEHPNEHRYILTIPGRGYRFVAEVKELESPDSAFNDRSLDTANSVPALAGNRLRIAEEVSGLPSSENRALPEVSTRPRTVVSALV